jgi:phosphate transport system permease protein
MTDEAPDRRPPSSFWEVMFGAATRGAGLFILTLAICLIVVLVLNSAPALLKANEFRIFTSTQWIPKPPQNDPTTPTPSTFGSLAFVYGTVVTSLIAMLIAVPLGVASAAYLSEIAPFWLKKVGAFLIELLAAIPSVVYGFWGFFVMAPRVQEFFNLFDGPNTGGNGILSAGLILAIMILPYITAITYDVCQAVPRAQREGSLAVGASRWQTIWNVVLPYARPGIFAASFLALGRALGETMAVTMLIGNQATVQLSIFALGDTIASRIANQLNEADEPAFRAALLALALVLMLVTAVFNSLARFLLWRLTRGPKAQPGPIVEVETTGRRDSTTLPPITPYTPSNRPQLWNRVMTATLGSCFMLTIIPLFLILGYITVRGVAALEPTLFTERARSPMKNDVFESYQKARQTGDELPKDELDRPVRRGGLGHAMLGSVMIVAIATIMAIPIGLLAAIYLAEARRSWFANVVRFVTELLGGVPSIVIGIFAYALLVSPFWLPEKTVADANASGIFGLTRDDFGFSGLAGAAALAIMMIPIVVRASEESMKLVPDSLRYASYALGANRMQTILRVVLPASLPAVVTGIFLAIGRIAGETAPLLLTAGNTDFWPKSPMTQTPFLPGYIFSYSRSQYVDANEQAWAGALVLLTVVMVLNVGIRLLAGKRVVAASSAA